MTSGDCSGVHYGSTVVDFHVILVWIPSGRVLNSPRWLVVRILLRRHWLGPARIINPRGVMGKEGVVRVEGNAWLCAGVVWLPCAEAAVLQHG
jgi:hypothetical protein